MKVFYKDKTMVESVTIIITDIKDSVSGILAKDISTILGFSKRQVEVMALNFVNALKDILIVALEKLWNALVKFIYKAVGLVI